MNPHELLSITYRAPPNTYCAICSCGSHFLRWSLPEAHEAWQQHLDEKDTP